MGWPLYKSTAVALQVQLGSLLRILLRMLTDYPYSRQ
jgi:hypothetical protein